MCTVVLSIRPGHAWPVCLAANRDELIARPWDPPAAWWPDHPGIIAGRDRIAGGTWMGLNRHGVTAAVLNRKGSLGPADGKRSRGELPLMALAHRTAGDAAKAVHAVTSAEWRGFNMVIADHSQALYLRGADSLHPTVHRLPPGVTMITSMEPNDPASPRVSRHLPRFQAAAAPVPDDWNAWRAILADQSGPQEEQINVAPRGGYGTVCSSFLGFPAAGAPVWLFAPGPPDQAPFSLIA